MEAVTPPGRPADGFDFLEVQREPVGLRSHEILESFYPSPPPFGG
jgi:hypothetical protein